MASQIVWCVFLITLQLSVVFSNSPDEIERHKGTTCQESSDCQNGGTCDENSQLCLCLTGTEGDLCQNVPECEVKRCGLSGTCKYDVEKQTAICVCNSAKHEFDPVDSECKRPCRWYSSDCENDGTCGGDTYYQFCRCVNGTFGDFCQYGGCSNKYCGLYASCKYDVERQMHICVCYEKDHDFNSVDYKCKRSCQDPSDCKNGGTCQRDEYSQFCRCLKGTKGDLCEKVPECDNKYCGRNRTCKYDIKRQIALCVCDDKDYEYDPIDHKCKRTCNFSSDCMNGGICEKDREFCRCLIGTEGDICEKVTECEIKDCGLNATCKYDVKKHTAICVCDHKDYEYDPVDSKCKRKCHLQDCKNGGTCSISTWFCRCLQGTKGDFCEDVPVCDYKACGSNATCQYDVGRRNAICVCPDVYNGYDPVASKCKRTCYYSSDCKNGGTCDRTKSPAFCSCLEGTKGDICDDVPVCDDKYCGPYATCKYDVKRRTGICVCHDKYDNFDPATSKCSKPDKSISDNGFNPSHIWILFVSLGGFTLFILTCFLIFCRRKKSLPENIQSSNTEVPVSKAEQSMTSKEEQNQLQNRLGSQTQYEPAVQTRAKEPGYILSRNREEGRADAHHSVTSNLQQYPLQNRQRFESQYEPAAQIRTMEPGYIFSSNRVEGRIESQQSGTTNIEQYPLQNRQGFQSLYPSVTEIREMDLGYALSSNIEEGKSEALQSGTSKSEQYPLQNRQESESQYQPAVQTVVQQPAPQLSPDQWKSKQSPSVQLSQHFDENSV